jgi:hypothetical protein
MQGDLRFGVPVIHLLPEGATQNLEINPVSQIEEELISDLPNALRLIPVGYRL